MTKEQKQVTEFMQKAFQDCPSKPTMPLLSCKKLRIQLIDEELAELADAFYKDNIVLTADAIADLLYVVLGTAVACGIQIDEIFQEVHRSNMSKFIDGRMIPSGKWLKGPSYQEAKIKPFIDKQLSYDSH